MATPYSKIVEAFLLKVRDYDLIKFTDIEKDDIIIGLMISACVKFNRTCLSDLIDRDDIIKQFNDDLTEEEIDIISEGMIVGWLKPIVFSSENLRNILNTKDFNQYSPANLLRELRETLKLSKQEYKALINNYSFANADFTKLGG